MTWINEAKPFVAGDDWVMTVTLKRDSAAVDITGATVTASIWQVQPAKVIEALADHAVAITTAASGSVTLTVTDTESQPLNAGTYKIDFKVVYSDATVEHYGGSDGEPYQFKVRRALT